LAVFIVVLGHAAGTRGGTAVDLVSEQLGAAPALGNITAVLIVQPAEALADEFDLAVAQHQVQQAADGLQGPVTSVGWACCMASANMAGKSLSSMSQFTPKQSTARHDRSLLHVVAPRRSSLASYVR